MKSSDLLAPSILVRLRYGPFEAQSRPVGKPYPRIAALALILLLLGCAIYIAGWRWGSYVFVAGVMVQSVLHITSVGFLYQREIFLRAAHLSNQWMVPIMLCGPIYMWLAAGATSLPRPMSGSDWQKVVFAIIFTFNGLNQTILHHLIARKQVNSA